MTDAAVLARLDQARAELRVTIAASRRALEAARQRLAPTREEIARLQADARSGQLGQQIQRLAGLVASGETTWEAVFDGSSPYAGLMREHFDAMARRYAGPVQAALAEEDFDPYDLDNADI